MLSLSVDGSAEAGLVQGRPALVTASLVHARAFTAGAAPVPLRPAGAWQRALRLRVEDASGRPATWAFAPAFGPSGPFEVGPVTVTGDAGASWGWVLDADATAQIAPGTYTLRLALDGSAVAAGAPDVAAPPVRVEVAEAPAAPTTEERAETALRRADVAAARGRTDEALAALAGLVAEQPFHVGARLRQAGWLRADHPVAALGALQYAVEGLDGDGRTEPPAALDAVQGSLVQAVEAATVFTVTLADKPPTHPLAGRGSTRAFALDGIAGREVVLRRGVTYTFRMAGVPASSPFVLAQDSAGTAPYTDGVDGAPASGDDTLTFTPGADTPTVLYYASATEPYAGWRLYVAAPSASDPPPGHGSGALALSVPTPNPSSGSVRMRLTMFRSQPVEVVVTDVLGRRVAVLLRGMLDVGAHPIALDASALAPGLYLVRAVSAEGEAATQRLTVAR